MKFNKLIIVVSGSCLSLLLIGSSLAANSSNAYRSFLDKTEIIQSSFDDLKDKLEQEKGNKSLVAVPLVQGDDFQISKQDFIFYKSNIEMINQLQNNNSFKSSSFSDDKLIDNMVKDELTVSYAKKLGLEVTSKEVNEAIQQERSLLNNPSITGENNDMVREILKHRIGITGLSEDEFWNNDQTKKSYEKAILKGKLFDKLVAEGKIKNDGADFGNYQMNLLKSSKGEVIVNKSELNN